MQTDETTVDPPEGDPPGTGGEKPSTQKPGAQPIAPDETLGDPPGTGGDDGDPPGTGGETTP